MTEDRENDRDNRKIVVVGWLRKNITITTYLRAIGYEVRSSFE